MIKIQFKTRLTAFLLFFSLLLSQTSGTVFAASARAADVNKAGAGNLLVKVSGTYESVGRNTILKRINEIRKEACVNGYRNPSTGRKLKASDYVPIKWSSNLEWIAQLRAAECTVYENHTRPNGKSCFSIQRRKEHSWAENLAWNYSGLMDGIEQWYREKNDWVSQNTNAVTGHYTSLINPNYKFIGLGSFRRDTGGWYGVSAEFGYSTNGSQKKSNLNGKTVQIIEVRKDCIKNPVLSAPSSIRLKKKKTLSVSCEIVYPGIMGGTNTTKATVTGGITWKSSKPSVLSVSSSGRITAKKTGKATITAKVKGGFTLKKNISVTR